MAVLNDTKICPVKNSITKPDYLNIERELKTNGSTLYSINRHIHDTLFKKILEYYPVIKTRINHSKNKYYLKTR